jgi:hypothetical protein
MFGLVTRQTNGKPAPRADRQCLYQVLLNGGPCDGHRLVSSECPAERLQLSSSFDDAQSPARPGLDRYYLVYEMLHSARPIGRPVIDLYYEFRGYLSTPAVAQPAKARETWPAWRERLTKLFRSVATWNSAAAQHSVGRSLGHPPLHTRAV